MAIFNLGRANAMATGGTGLGGSPGAGMKLIFTSSAITGNGSISVTNVSNLDNVVVSTRGASTTLATTPMQPHVAVVAVTDGLQTTAPVVSVIVTANDATTGDFHISTSSVTVELIAVGCKRPY